MEEILAAVQKPKKGTRVCFDIDNEFRLGMVTRGGSKLYITFDNGAKRVFPARSIKYVGIVGNKKLKKAVDPKLLYKYMIASNVTPAKLKKNWRKYIYVIDTETLVELIRKAKDKYYKTSKPMFSDDLFDIIEDELRRRYPKHKLLEQVDAPTKKIGDVKLPFYMPSLDKAKDQKKLDRFLKKNSGPFVVADKMDGISIGIKGERKYTRGSSGKVGQDISHLPIKLPKAPKAMEIRGELEITEAKFKKVFPDASNARNTTSGLIGRKNIDPKVARAMDIICYEIINPVTKPSTALKKLKKMGFKVVPHKIFKTLDAVQLTEYYQERKKKSKYAIDGLVITQDSKNKRPKSGMPDYAIAFKVNALEDSKIATVTKVEWRLSKHGYWKPRIHVKPLKLGSVNVKHFTGFNAFFILNGFRKTERNRPVRPVGPGAKLRVIRSGEVIPHIMEVVKGVREPQMPEKDYVWTESRMDILAPGKSSSVDIKKITAFFKVLGIKDVSQQTFTAMYNQGYDTVPKIIKVTERQLRNIPGFKEKKIKNTLSAIQKVTKQVELHKLAFASGCFGRTMGSKRLKVIFTTFPKIMTKRANSKMTSLIAQLPGFKDKTAAEFTEGLKLLKPFIKKLPKSLKVVEPKKIKKSSNKLAGKRYVFTGFRNANVKDFILKNGGEVGDSVNNNTVLIVKNDSFTSSKITKAEEKGLKIFTLKAFMKKYKIKE